MLHRLASSLPYSFLSRTELWCSNRYKTKKHMRPPDDMNTTRRKFFRSSNIVTSVVVVAIGYLFYLHVVRIENSRQRTIAFLTFSHEVRAILATQPPAPRTFAQFHELVRTFRPKWCGDATAHNPFPGILPKTASYGRLHALPSDANPDETPLMWDKKLTSGGVLGIFWSGKRFPNYGQPGSFSLEQLTQLEVSAIHIPDPARFADPNTK